MKQSLPNNSEIFIPSSEFQKSVVVLLGFGSNLGDRRSFIECGWDSVCDLLCVEAVCFSSIIETKAVGGGLNQPDFLNAAGLIRTTLSPEILLDRLQEIEINLGRVRTVRWGSRTLDIDILLFDDLVINTLRLTVPHPLMFERNFVLIPATEIAPEMIKSAAKLRGINLDNLSLQNH
ncbi:MAG: 2-amino-4-hydroxy-6-hydroxymethyldihydropteridine diphosphokinase [Planctomycetaceae bacterium]|jgi:2-amino-4-hydroxy-6-hydroxymethyldihydropteridine diphosphokinase|nr:2-amino-4-hydroxy-6-hydroxymethyldihydropteridine diphosphokinase [Planctomycetaceae bacterium]